MAAIAEKVAALKVSDDKAPAAEDKPADAATVDAATAEAEAPAPKELTAEEIAKAAKEALLFQKRKEIMEKLERARHELNEKEREKEHRAKEAEMTEQQKKARYFGMHPTITCDGCGMKPIAGYRFKCIQCANHDICETCHDEFVKTGITKNVMGNANRLSKDATAHNFKVYAEPGCFKPLSKAGGAAQGKATQKQGTKVKPNDKCPCGSGKKYKKCCRGKGTALGTKIVQKIYNR